MAEAQIRIIKSLLNARYYYKFIVNGDWQLSTSSPSERDGSGNVNNIIIVGDTASVLFTLLLLIKEGETSWFSHSFDNMARQTPEYDSFSELRRFMSHAIVHYHLPLAILARLIS
ncbi:hypothetical protein ACFX15_012447 [Malus domestica]